MKKAIGYIRISTEDQSNFSIDGQERLIVEFCQKQNIQLINLFKDEGQSAKNFDRINWKNLEAFIKTNYKEIDTLIVAKYDRFSRNLREALTTIETLENKYNITIVSVNENIGLHPKSPYYFQMRSQMLLGAEVEWRMIKDRTKFGIHTAQKAGRWLNAAPYGYTNARDESNKPIIVINPEKAKAIKLIFQNFLIGTTIEQIRKILKENGFILKGKSAIQSILRNPVYCGKIKVSAYYDEPEQLVKGLHEPLISELDWFNAQAILNTKKEQLHLIIRDEVALRGVLHCHCNKLLTAGNSKSRNGNYYWYYKCNTHLTPNFRADTLHTKFDEILNFLTLSDEQINIIKKIALENLNKNLESNKLDLTSNQKSLKLIELKISSLEEKYILNEIEKEVYFKLKPQYLQEQILLQQKIESLSKPISDIIERFDKELYKLKNLAFLYHDSTTIQKQSFVKTVFYNSLSWVNDCYRTSDILPIFYSKALLLKEKKLLIIEKLLPKNTIFGLSAPQSTSIEPILSVKPLIDWINSLKIA